MKKFLISNNTDSSSIQLDTKNHCVVVLDLAMVKI